MAPVAGQEGLGKQMFMHALFELADNWTDGKAVQEYVTFLRDLFSRIAKGRHRLLRGVGIEGAAFLARVRRLH